MSIGILCLSSCVKNTIKNDISIDPETTELNIPLNFDWKMTKAQTITISEPSHILNSKGDTIASNLLSGTYNITMPISESYMVKSAPELTKSNDTPSKRYFPNQHQDATAIYEDTFPYTGDMDLNDVFMSFNLEYHVKYDNKNNNKAHVESIKIKYKAISCGSAYNNIAIGVHLNLDPTKYSVKVTGKQHKVTSTSLFQVEKDGYEPGIEKTIVVPLIIDYKDEFSPALNGGMANVFANLPTHKATQDNTLIKIDGDPDFDYLDFNNGNVQFFAVFNERSHEVFPKGSTATEKFNKGYFKNLKREDFSRGSDNMVWAFIVPLDYETGFYPALENVHIFDAYPQFRGWVESNGTQNLDWFKYGIAEKTFSKKL